MMWFPVCGFSALCSTSAAEDNDTQMAFCNPQQSPPNHWRTQTLAIHDEQKAATAVASTSSVGILDLTEPTALQQQQQQLHSKSCCGCHLSHRSAYPDPKASPHPSRAGLEDLAKISEQHRSSISSVIRSSSGVASSSSSSVAAWLLARPSMSSV